MLPVAVGVFTFPSTAVTVLPLLLTPSMPQIAVAITGLVAGVTLLTGVFAQPLGRRLGAVRAGPTGLAIGAAGLGLSLVGVACRAPGRCSSRWRCCSAPRTGCAWPPG